MGTITRVLVGFAVAGSILGCGSGGTNSPEVVAPVAAGNEFGLSVTAQDIWFEPTLLRAPWLDRVDEVLKEATLERPADVTYLWHGKRGQHGEHLSRLLADMQYMQRTYPGAKW